MFPFLENILSLGIFPHAPPHLELTPNFVSSHTRQKEITHSLREHSFFENLFIQQQEEGDYDLL